MKFLGRQERSLKKENIATFGENRRFAFYFARDREEPCGPQYGAISRRSAAEVVRLVDDASAARR
jgi:hypothetical protein